MNALTKLGIGGPSVMGILNVTPDSFSDGGQFQSVDAALRQAQTMVDDGAVIVDVGGESTRPGAASVSIAEELDRVIPVIEAIATQLAVKISVDTSRPEVMAAAVAAGAHMINDIRALQLPNALAMAASLQAPVCLMHMQGEPGTMQDEPQYDDVVVDVTEFLLQRVTECEDAGLERSLLLIDPGFGFGKLPAHNMQLLARLERLESLDLPVLLGVSRKSTLGVITGRNVDDRLSASIAAATIGVMKGATIIRAHDVAETVDAVKVAQSILELT
ncbi:MAG: dihydropteroate synthase [Pseudomonadota bacterium]